LFFRQIWKLIDVALKMERRMKILKVLRRRRAPICGKAEKRKRNS
jgi:hypothetical protein